MPVDRSAGQFDKVLGQALRTHSEPVPADFTDKVLRRIRAAEERKILARVVLQERLALAGCIVSGVVAIGGAAALSSLAGSLPGQAEVFIAKISRIIEAASRDWQFYTVLGGLLLFAAYSFVYLCVGDT